MIIGLTIITIEMLEEILVLVLTFVSNYLHGINKHFLSERLDKIYIRDTKYM